MITVLYTGKQEVVIGHKFVLPGETFSIAPGLLPALITEHGDVFNVPGQAAEVAPEAFVAGDVAPAKVGRPKKL